MNNYKIPLPLFINELWINAYRNQIDGYPVGHPSRVNFQPETAVSRDKTQSGGINREETLELTMYTFTPEQKALLLEKK